MGCEWCVRQRAQATAYGHSGLFTFILFLVSPDHLFFFLSTVIHMRQFMLLLLMDMFFFWKEYQGSTSHIKFVKIFCPDF